MNKKIPIGIGIAVVAIAVIIVGAKAYFGDSATEVEKVPVEIENTRNIVILGISVAVASLTIFILLNARNGKKRPKVIESVVSPDIETEQLVLQHSGMKQKIIQDDVSKEMFNKIMKISEKYSGISKDEIENRKNQDPYQSEYYLKIIASSQWYGYMTDGDDLISIRGNGPALLPFKGKEFVMNSIYNVSVKRARNNGKIEIAIIKNDVILDQAESKEGLESVTLVGKC